MTTSEQSVIKAAIQIIRNALGSPNNPATAQLNVDLNRWAVDCDAAATNVNPALTSGQSFKALPVVTVANLLGAPVSGDEAIVTDAKNVTAGATVVGGGSIRTPVRYSGSAWQVVPLALTVATLPASPATNDEAVVTDATVATNGTTVAGGGSTRVLVRYNGSVWQIV